MTGYHYTSWKNWESIEMAGLKPYNLNKPEISKALWNDGILCHGEPVYAIFVWRTAHSGRELAGDIMFHALGKVCTRVVELEVQYAPDDRLVRDNGGMIDLFHSMDPNGPGVNFWHDQVPALLLKNPVPPERIRLCRVFDLAKCDLLVCDGAIA